MDSIGHDIFPCNEKTCRMLINLGFACLPGLAETPFFFFFGAVDERDSNFFRRGDDLPEGVTVTSLCVLIDAAVTFNKS